MPVFMTDGTLIQREVTPGGGTYATIPQAMNITPPSYVRKTAEVAIHDQATPVKKIGGREAQTVTFELAFDPTNATYHQQLYTDENAKTERSYQIVYPDTGTAQFRFNAVIESIEPGEMNAEGTDPISLTVTLGLSASPTITW